MRHSDEEQQFIYKTSQQIATCYYLNHCVLNKYVVNKLQPKDTSVTEVFCLMYGKA